MRTFQCGSFPLVCAKTTVTMIRREPTLVNQPSSSSPTFLGEGNPPRSSNVISPATLQKRLSQSPPDDLLVKRLPSHRPAEPLHASPHPESFSLGFFGSLALAWCEGGSPIHRLKLFFQGPPRPHDDIKESLKRTGTKSCISFDYSTIPETDWYYYQHWWNHLTKILSPFSSHESIMGWLLYPAPLIPDHPLQSRKTELLMEHHVKRETKRRHITGKTILQSLGF